MPSSPRTPGHSRHPSNIDLSYATHSRRQSKNSLHSPTTPIHPSPFGVDIFSSGGATSNGLGNLADELADGWDEDELEEEADMNFQNLPVDMEATRDSGVDVTGSPMMKETKHPTLTAPSNSRKHERKGSDYDGSDYGEESDMESAGISPGLIARMDVVESLARRGTEANGTDGDGIVQRVVDSLKDLGTQSSIETNTTR